MVKVNPINVLANVPLESNMFKKSLFWTANVVDLAWAILMLYVAFSNETPSLYAWAVLIVLALYPLECMAQRFKIKRLEGE